MSEHDPTRPHPPEDLSKDLFSHPPVGQERQLDCEQWHGLIADALDGTLPAAASAALEQHRRQCAACTQMLEQARQGVAWLGYLQSDPPPAADLLAKILARTSGPAAITAAAPATAGLVSTPAFRAPHFGAWHHMARVIEPRLWMTAAMAFFSIALTLNLFGLRLSEIRLADLQPSVALTNVTRQYYSTKEEGVKYYDNLRFVHEMEAQVRDQVRELRRSQESAPAPLPQDTPRPQSPSSLNEGPGRRAPAPRAEGNSAVAEGQPNIRIRTQAERSLA